MRIPHLWEDAVLALAVYRFCRFLGWDEWPPIAKARARLIGERWVPADRDPDDFGLPGKQPTSEASGVRPAYDRPMLAHLVHCPFCLGVWNTAWVYGLWLAWPRPTMYVMSAAAIAAAAGLIAKQLDP